MNLFVARKNLLLLKIKNSTILIIFEMISFKSIKLLGNFIDWTRIYARILFETARIYLILVDHLPNTMKEFKNLKQKWTDKACFAHDAAYYDKDLAKRTISDKILEDRACEIARSHKYDGYQRALAGMVYKFFDIGLCEI